MDLQELLLNQRAIFILDNIEEELSKEVIPALLYLDSISNEDITIYINSRGGHIDEALAISNIMKSLKSDVRTFVIGASYSATTLIVSSGTRGKRFAVNNTIIHMHELSTNINDYTTNLIAQAKSLKNTQNQMLSQLANNTYGKTNINKMRKIFKNDCYLTPEQALEIGLIDNIVDKIPFPEGNS